MLPRWIDAIQDLTGNGLAGVTVTVKTWKGADAVLYADRDGTQTIPGNVLSTDSRGQYGFFAAPGHYTLITAASGQVVDTREISLGSGESLNPEWFGIKPGTTADISTALQNWVNELVQADHHNFPSGDVRSGVIRLPYCDAITDSIVLHPAVSVIADVRGGTTLTLKPGATAVGVDNLPALFYIVARARSSNSNPAWMPEFRNLRGMGNAARQGTLDCCGIYAEPVANDTTLPDYSPIGYSAFLGANCDLANFTSHGVVCGVGRQRLTLVDRFRSSNHGRTDSVSGVPLNLANAYKLNGNQCVLIGVGGGGCTGHSLLASGTSGLLVSGSNIWGSDGVSRSSQAIAINLFNCNGFSITNNVINDTVSIDGGPDNSDRSSEFSGNQMKPNDPVFTADGVTAGTADDSYNCHVRVSRSQNITIGENGYGAGGSTGFRYQNIVTVLNGARVFAEFSSSSFYAPGNTPPLYVKPWASSNVVPIVELDTARCFYRFTDVNLGATWSNLAHGGVEGANQNFIVKSAPNDPTVIQPQQQDNFLKFTGTVAAMNLQLPYPPLPGVPYRFQTVNAITALNVSLSSAAAADGESFVSAPPTTLAAGGSFKLLFRPSVKQWWPAP